MAISIRVSLVLMLMMNGVKAERREVTVSISDLSALQNDLLSNGMNSRAVEMIYAAASCNLRRHEDLDSKISRLMDPIEQMHASMNGLLNEMLRRNENLSEKEGTLDLVFRHRLITETETIPQKTIVKSEADHKVYPAITNHDEAEYLAMGYREETIDPELCKTYAVVKDLIAQSKTRRHEVLKLAHSHYGFTGPHTISVLAKFYFDYVTNNYDERIKVMGLAKILGEFTTLVSDAYFLEDAFKAHKEKCGLNLEHQRKKRNVMQSMISAGVCTRNFGPGMNGPLAEVKFMSKVPFRSTLKSGSLTALGMCSDAQTAWSGVVEKSHYRNAISASYKSGVEACVRVAVCPSNHSFNGVDCDNTKPIGEFSNIEDLELSIIRNRVPLSELPDELKELSKTYCSIQGKTVTNGKQCEKPVRSTERFTMFSIGGKWLFTDKDVLVAHGQDVTNLCFFNCDGGCPRDCHQCKGDEAYESVFGKWPNANCSCRYCEDCSDLYMQIGSAKVGIDAVAHANWDVTIPVREEESVQCSGCKVSCRGRSLRVERDIKFDIIHLCVHDNCRLINEQKTDFDYVLPSEFLHVTDFRVMFFRSDGKGKTVLSVSCYDSHTCLALHCDLCLPRFANPHCYKAVNWVILVLAISSLILVIPLACIIYRIAKLALYVLLSPAKLAYKITRALCKKCTRKSRSMVNTTSERLTQFADEQDEIVRVRTMNKPFSVSLVVILILIPCALTCENVITVDSKVLSCLPSTAGEIKCAVNTIIEVPLSSLGEESCINVNDQSGNVVHIIKLRTSAIRQKCSKSVLYYTNDADFKLLNVFRCRNAGECEDDNCEKVKTEGPVPVPSANKDKAGFHGCTRVTGFWGKGCFYASQACQFYKVELQNTERKSYEVSRCSEWFWEVKVNITVSSKDGVRNETLILDNTLPTKTIIGQIQILSVNTPVITITDKCFLRKLSGSMLTAIVDCSNRNHPIIGKIGGVQCATPTLAERASKSCLIDYNSIHVVAQDDNVVFVNRFSNASEEWKNNLLPSNLTMSVVSEDASGVIYLHHTGQASYNVRIRMEDYKISYTVVRATCEAHFRKLRGCANCGTGATLEVEVILTNSVRSPVTVKCPSALNTGSELVTSANPLTKFKLSFTVSEIEEKCVISCSGNVVEIDVRGELINNIKIQNQNQTNLLGRGSDFFASIPWGNFGFLRYFYLVIGVLLVIPVVYILYIGLIKCVTRVVCSRKFSRQRKGKKY
uniref:Glycoprotein n=1 Tax=Phasivirus phasiense TaxID=3052631 RepID=A0A859GWA4_9VIRU|nr:glycoprotein [Phasivirus phasiense]